MQAYNFVEQLKDAGKVPERRKFRREGEERRREQLVSAALDVIASEGADRATVRAIADRAGVTQGLIRHYFLSKDALTRTAYDTHMQRINAISFAASDAAEPFGPATMLAAFVTATLLPEALTDTAFGLWTGFVQRVRRDPEMAAIHSANYLAYRDQLEALITRLPAPGGGQRTEAELRRLAIACNAVLDGLWLEGSAWPQGFADGELARIGLDAVSALIDYPLPLPPALAKDAALAQEATLAREKDKT